MTGTPKGGLILAVHATTRGMGWVAFEGPITPYDWGTVDARRHKNASCLKRLERLFRRLQPEALVLENWPRPGAAPSQRIMHLNQAFVSLAQIWDVTVRVYDRGDVRACFSAVGAKSRQEIAEAIARHIEAFEHLLPRRRAIWESQHPRLALFTSAALAFTYYQHEQLTDSHELLCS